MLRVADVMTAFHQSQAAASASASAPTSVLGATGMDMHVSVLTSGFWPSYPVMEANLPPVRMGLHGVHMGLHGVRMVPPIQ